MGPNAKELFRLVEDFIDVIGFRMKDFRDSYQVTDNLGESVWIPLLSPAPLADSNHAIAPCSFYELAVSLGGGKCWSGPGREQREPRSDFFSRKRHVIQMQPGSLGSGSPLLLFVGNVLTRKAPGVMR